MYATIFKALIMGFLDLLQQLRFFSEMHKNSKTARCFFVPLRTANPSKMRGMLLKF